MKKILVLEDEENIRSFVVINLNRAGYETIEAGTGEEALEQRLKKTYDVLKTAHHGSRNSTSESFLQKASPSAALISAGRDNRYGHPHQETLDRLRREGCSVYQTAQSGSVTIVTDGRTMRIRRFLP